MRLEQFTYAMFNGGGYKLTKSPGVDGLMHQKTLKTLMALTESDQRWCPVEDVVACTHVEHGLKDEFGRSGRWNHTILMPIQDYLAYTQPVRLMEPYFLGKQAEPTELEPLQIGV